MLSLEGQVLERHLELYQDKTILCAGVVKDSSLEYLSTAASVEVFSSYFDTVRHCKNKATFGLEYCVQADLIIYFWTKNKQENLFALSQLLSTCTLGQEMLIVGENKSGVRSAEKLLAEYGRLQKIDNARRCSLYFFLLEKQPHFALQDWWKSYHYPYLPDLTVYSLPGVFSAGELDKGTELLLSTFNEPLNDKTVLDICCGAGVVGAYLKKQSPNINLTLSDIHAAALASSEKTLQMNQLEGKVVASDVFSNITGKFDLIVANPPFHDGTDVSYRTTSELIQQAKHHLNKGGELRLVANTFLPYPELLQYYFSEHQILAKNGRFIVYRVFASS